MGMGMGMGMGSEGDTDIEVEGASVKTEKKDLVIGVVTAVVLTTVGFGVALFYYLSRAGRNGSMVVVVQDNADGTMEPSSTETKDLTWEASFDNVVDHDGQPNVLY